VSVVPPEVLDDGDPRARADALGAGAERIGASSGVAIVEDFRRNY